MTTSQLAEYIERDWGGPGALISGRINRLQLVRLFCKLSRDDIKQETARPKEDGKERSVRSLNELGSLVQFML